MSDCFLLYALPDVRHKTNDRLEILTTIIDNLSKDVLKTLREDCTVQLLDLDDEQTRDLLVRSVEEYWDLSEDATDTYGSMILPGCKLAYIFTGGTSGGDQPTDESDMFQLLAACGPVVDQLQAWAEQEHLERCWKS